MGGIDVFYGGKSLPSHLLADAVPVNNLRKISLEQRAAASGVRFSPIVITCSRRHGVLFKRAMFRNGRDRNLPGSWALLPDVPVRRPNDHCIFKQHAVSPCSLALFTTVAPG